MTLITFSEIDGHITIIMKDHATGSPETCAALSALVYTLEGWLRNHESKVYNHVCKLESGYATVEFNVKDYLVYEILGFIYLGMVQIEHSYGKYCKVMCDNSLKNILGVN